MSVIPFNPAHRPPKQRSATEASARPADRSRPPGRDCETASAAPGGTGRIELLERTLLAALRENATNWARAERAGAFLDGAEPVLAAPPGGSREG